MDQRDKPLVVLGRSVRSWIAILSRRNRTLHGNFRMRGLSESWKRALVENNFRAGAPKQVWYDTLEFEAYVISNTSLDIYLLQGEVPETVMLGGNSDISQFCKHWFYY